MYQERCRILVVDDSADNLFLLQVVLEEEGYEVELADSGSSALAKIFASAPDLILLDMMMPGMNGIEVVQRLRENDQLKELPIVLITAYEEEFVKQGLNVEINGCLRKPINFEELLQKVRSLCEV